MADAPNHPSEMTEEERAAAMEKAQKDAATAQELEKFQAMRKLLVEALTFAEIINEAAETVTHLLSSKNKSEVIEAMDFFVTVHAYAVSNAKLGIRRMLRLIWTKGNSDEERVSKLIYLNATKVYTSMRHQDSMPMRSPTTSPKA
jgi:condensin complex subunit 1